MSSEPLTPLADELEQDWATAQQRLDEAQADLQKKQAAHIKANKRGKKATLKQYEAAQLVHQEALVAFTTAEKALKKAGEVSAPQLGQVLEGLLPTHREGNEDAQVKAGADDSEDAQADTDMQVEAVDMQAKAKADADAQAKAIEAVQAKADADALAQAIADAQAKADADARAKAIADAQAVQAKADADALAQAIADAQAKAIADAQAEADTQAKADADARAKAIADAQAEADVQAKADADARAKAIVDAQAEADVQAKADADARAKAIADAQAKAIADAQAAWKVKTKKQKKLKDQTAGDEEEEIGKQLKEIAAEDSDDESDSAKPAEVGKKRKRTTEGGEDDKKDIEVKWANSFSANNSDDQEWRRTIIQECDDSVTEFLQPSTGKRKGKISAQLRRLMRLVAEVVPRCATTSRELALHILTNHQGKTQCRFHDIKRNTKGAKDVDRPDSIVGVAFSKEMVPATGYLACGCDEDAALWEFFWFKTWKITSQNPKIKTIDAMRTDSSDVLSSRQRGFLAHAYSGATLLKVDDIYSADPYDSEQYFVNIRRIQARNMVFVLNKVDPEFRYVFGRMEKVVDADGNVNLGEIMPVD